MTAPAKHAPMKTTTEPEATPATTTHAIIEAELPSSIEILEEKTVVIGSGSINFRAGQRYTDRWFISAAINHHIAHSVIETETVVPKSIIVNESKFFIVSSGRATMSVKAGQTISDPVVVTAVIRSGVKYSDSDNSTGVA